MRPDAPATTSPQRPRRRELVLHLYTLCSFAIAQPLYDLLARSPAFLVAHHLESWDLILLVAVLSLLLPALPVVAYLLLTLLGPRPGELTWAAAATVLAAAFALRLEHRLGAEPAWLALVAAYGLGILVALGLLRRRTVRWLLAVLSPGIVLFPLLFLARPGVSRLLVPDEPAPVQATTMAGSPIVLVVFDELALGSLLDRNLEINAHRYPHFAALAREATWFRNATTVADDTNYALPAILTGRYPASGQRLPLAAAYPESLFTWLGKGYELTVFEFQTSLCPPDLCARPRAGEAFVHRWRTTLADLAAVYLRLVTPPELAVALPDVTATWRDFWTPGQPPAAGRRQGVPAQVEDFLANLRPGRRPGLFFLHLALPHRPWMYLPSGREYRPVGATPAPHWELDDGRWPDHEYLTVQGFQRHLLQLGYADRVLGRIVDRVRRTGLWDRTLLVVTSDHGLSFWPETPYRAATDDTLAEVAAVPLFVKVPGQRRGATSDRQVATIDVLPTIADALGSELPWPVDGRSVLASADAGRERTLYSLQPGRPPRRWVLPPRLAGLAAVVERKLALFGSGQDPEEIFRIGPYRDLIGRPLAELAVTGDSGLEALLVDAGAFDHVDPESDFVPAHVVVGFARVKNDPPRRVAVAVNGTIRAVGEAYQDLRGGWWLNAMVPEASLRCGANRVEVFLVTSGAPRLAAVEIRRR